MLLPTDYRSDVRVHPYMFIYRCPNNSVNTDRETESAVASFEDSGSGY